MNNLMDVVQQTDIPEMFSKIEQIYLQTLGIELFMLDDHETYPKMSYVLRDPQKFSFLNRYTRNFMLDPVEDIAPLLTSYCDRLVISANAAELEDLQQKIETNRNRQSMFETDARTDAQSDCVNLYLDKLFVSVIKRQRQLQEEENNRTSQRIQAIVSEKKPADMYKKLIEFYQSELGIGLYEQSSDEDLQDMQTVLRVDDDYKKIKSLGLDLKQRPNLDTEDLISILEAYLKPIIASLALEDLFKLGMQTKAVNDHLEYKEHEDFELARYIGPLHDAIKEQLHVHIDAILDQPDISVHQLALIVNHLDLLTEQSGPDDIENYLSSIHDTAEREKLRDLPNTELRQIIQTEKIKDYFQRFDNMQLTDAADLLETCDLKTYLTILQLQKTHADLGVTHTLKRLAAPVELGLRQLLNNYKTDVESSVSDRYKTQKLECIEAMLAKLDDPKLGGQEKIEQIKVLFDKNPTLHEKEPIGRYLYRCLCALFNKTYHAANYQMTLFKELSGEDGAKNESNHKHQYKRLGQ